MRFTTGRSGTLLVMMTFALVAGLAAPAAQAWQAPFEGKLKLKLKERFEDESKNMVKDRFPGTVTDFSSGTEGVLMLAPGLSLTMPVADVSNRKAKFVRSADPDEDLMALEDFLNALDGDRCTADVTDLLIKGGSTHKVTGNFKRSKLLLKLKGSYVCLDGPRQDETVGFKLKLLMPRGKRIVF